MTSLASTLAALQVPANSLLYGLMVLPMLGGVVLLRVLLKTDRLQSEEELKRRRMIAYTAEPAAPVEKRSRTRQSPAAALRAVLRGTAGRRLDRSERGRRLARELARADLKLRSEEWIAIVIGSSVLGALLFVLRFGSPFAGLMGGFVGYFMTGVFLRFRQGRRMKKFEAGLGETIVSMSNALKAGHSFNAALRIVAESAPPPINTEFNRLVTEIAFGVTVEDALDTLVKRNGSEDLELLVTAVKINRSAGGNLAEILDTIEETIRGRLKVKGQIRTLTAQARASGWIVTLLPFGLAGILTLISPSYFNPMFHKTMGLVMLGIGGFGVAVGAGIINKIVKIKV